MNEIIRVLIGRLLVGFVLALFTSCSLMADDIATVRESRVVGYLPDYRFAEFDGESLLGLTDLILFSAEPNADGSLNLKRLANCPWERVWTYKTKHRVRLSLAVGGWDRSTHFAEVVASGEKRKRFVAEVIRMAIEHRLDGIDLDWEHPRDTVEAEGYGRLLADLRSGFNRYGLQLTVTIAAWQQLPRSAIEAVDAVQVMAYDHDDQHSTFDGARRDVQSLITMGVPRQKIVLGMPLYGRDIETRQAKTYREIVSAFDPDPSTDQIGTLYFNGPDTIRRKMKFAADARLGGVMVWEVGQDATGDQSLLRVIREFVTRKGGE